MTKHLTATSAHHYYSAEVASSAGLAPIVAHTPDTTGLGVDVVIAPLENAYENELMQQTTVVFK